jgi:serine/threonine protein kinase
MATRPLRPQDPRWLGGYQLLGRLGEGGMGTVYLGRAKDGRVVAVKAIRPEYADQEEFRARFRSEVNRVLQVPAFCTAAVLDADPDHETPYLIVEYVDGPSLQEIVRERGPMAAGDLHGVAVGVAAALTAIHGAGVIHRDLKPTNVLFSLGLPKVIDFGIARALEPTSRHTRTDHVMGTVSYMAPERGRRHLRVGRRGHVCGHRPHPVRRRQPDGDRGPHPRRPARPRRPPRLPGRAGPHGPVQGPPAPPHRDRTAPATPRLRPPDGAPGVRGEARRTPPAE